MPDVDNMTKVLAFLVASAIVVLIGYGLNQTVINTHSLVNF